MSCGVAEAENQHFILCEKNHEIRNFLPAVCGLGRTAVPEPDLSSKKMYIEFQTFHSHIMYSIN